MMRKIPVLWALFFGVMALGVEYLPFSQVVPGMTGYGLTVVAGGEISRFQVEVVGVIDEPGTANDFIVIRASGDAIKRSGGIAQGMSGSPIYLEGRLAGALSRAALWAAEPEHPLGLVTPIEPMLAVLEEARGAEGRLPPGVKEVRYVAAPPEELESSVLYILPVHSPIMATGLKEHALGYLRQGLDLEGFRLAPALMELMPFQHETLPGLEGLGVGRIVQVSSPQTPSHTSPSFAPGMPLGVGLVVGDITLGALGTVTLTDGDALVAFGHPFLFSGPVSFFLNSARILDTVAAYDAPFKLGTMGEVVGGIYVDRWAGIGGRVGDVPPGIDMAFYVQDRSRMSSGKLSSTMVHEPRLEPLLLFISGLEATDRALDRIGPGTVTVSYTIQGKGMPRPLSRQNVFLSTRDVAVYVPLEAAIVTDILEYNEFQDPELTGIRITASVSPELKAMEVVDLVTDADSYAPGDTISFRVLLRTWRGEIQAWEGKLDIPEDLDAPYVELRAYGGPRAREKGESPPVFHNLEDLIAYIEDIPSFNTLTVELFAPDPLSTVVGETRLRGIDSLSDIVGEAVVYGQVSVYLPLEGSGW